MFQVIDLDSQSPIMEFDAASGREVIRLFATGQEAQAAARAVSEYNPGKKFQPRPYQIDSEAWRNRERERFASGAYKFPVWQFEQWWRDAMSSGGEVASHFCHISTDDPTRIAYTASDEKGAQDCQTRSRPGAYLKKFFGSEASCGGVLSDQQIQFWAIEHETRTGVSELKFATTPEEIDRVYRNGPRSCMNNPNDYPSILNRDKFPIHPAHVYAAGDLAVAYSESNGRITARCIVWPERKLYGRVYGDRLSSLLVNAGYSAQEGWSFTGARLLKVRNSYYGSWTMPYVDGSNYVHESECGKFFIIGEPRRAQGRLYCCCNTTGTTDESCDPDYEEEDDRAFCEHCEERVESVEYIRDIQQHWCNDCAESNAACCEATGDWNQEDYVILSCGTVWSLRYFESHGETCEDCCEHYDSADEATIESEHDGLLRCTSCHAEHEAEHAQDNAPLDEREPTPTIHAPNQITLAIPEPVELYEVALFTRQGGLFVGVASFDRERANGRDKGTRQEAESLAAWLGGEAAYYRIEIRRVQPAPVEVAA